MIKKNYKKSVKTISRIKNLVVGAKQMLKPLCTVCD